MDTERFQMLTQFAATAEEEAALTAIMDKHNENVDLKWAPEPLSVILRDADDVIVGGLTGNTNWGWLYVDTLAVAEELRGSGAGSKLLAEAEKIAIQRGCEHSFLNTFSFQALGFYEKHDYEVYGVLDDFPRGAQRYFLRKKLQPRG